MSLLIGYIGTILGYLVPLILVYHFAYSRSGGFFTFLFLFVMAYLIGFLACLLFYRMAVLGKSGQIANMPRSTVIKVMGTSFASFMIVAVTIFAIGFNPNLVKIFENTVGYSYIQLLGAGEFANSIFTSPILDQLNDETETKYFNYAFLLTAFDTKNIQQFIQASMNKVGGEQEQTTTTNNLPFNFTLKPLEKDKIEKLEEFVYTKHRIGHFTWVYLTSVLALTVSFISMTMYN
tara:strand:+ start:608 stop:1309 length:702 start_codon:yes stop_codon:yes gene_type:complete